MDFQSATAAQSTPAAEEELKTALDTGMALEESTALEGATAEETTAEETTVDDTTAEELKTALDTGITLEESTAEETTALEERAAEESTTELELTALLLVPEAPQAPIFVQASAQAKPDSGL